MIGDAGNAKKLETSPGKMTNIFGTNNYMPPEYHEGKRKEMGKAIDIW